MPTKAKAKAKPKDPPINEIIVKEPTPPPTPIPSPPPSPPPLERSPKKRNPPNYKLKIRLLHILSAKYKVDDATLGAIADLFHITKAIESYNV